jgi:alkanesulfonate monooxygenase SsuD/methylene tetrahydromethanopterin reductase-like flavin-dependent oxidoreductase (luciferase family)
MRLGMFMHPIHDFKRGYHTLLFEDLDVIRAADQEGFDEVWLGEHYLLPSEPFASPLMLYARLIAECPRITFGSGVLCLPNKHPALVAGEVAQFDHLAKGRFMLGIGPGAAPPDFELFGVLDKNRMEMLEESIDMMIRLWTEDPPYEINGKYWQAVVKENVLPDLGVGKMTVPYQRPHPPIMLPSMSRNSASSRLAARRGWHMISANFVPKEVVAGHWRDHCEERRTLGLSPEPAKWRAGRTLLVTETDEEASAYLRTPGNSLEWYFRYIIGLTRHGGFVHMLKSDQDMPDAEVTPQYCIDTMVIAGSPRSVAERLAAFREEVGPFETLITSHHDWVPLGMWRRHMHLLAHEVMPILRSLTGVRQIPREDWAKTS